MICQTRMTPMLALIGTVVMFLGTTDALFAAPLLSVDIDDRGASDPANTESGFEQFLMDGAENDDSNMAVTRSFGSIDVTINHSNGGNYGDRRRGEPTNSGLFTEQELLRDFIFARGTTEADGLDILINGLDAGVDHRIKIWSADDGSTPTRVSDWTANGVLAKDDYSFDGGDIPPAPADNDVYSFGFVSAADANGDILVQGRFVSGDCCAVFLNALSIEVVPEPSTFMLAAFGLLAIIGCCRRGGSR